MEAMRRGDELEHGRSMLRDHPACKRGAFDRALVRLYLRVASRRLPGIVVPELTIIICTLRRTGIMWHPEREQPFADHDLALFRQTFLPVPAQAACAD